MEAHPTCLAFALFYTYQTVNSLDDVATESTSKFSN